MSQLKHITFNTKAGGEQTLRLQDYESGEQLEYWSEADKALSGKLRHNMRGSRGVYRIEYRHCMQASKYRSVLNNIVSDLTSGEDSITLSEGQDLSNARVVTPTEDFMQRLEYRNTITGFFPTLEFKDVGESRVTGSYVETGYVEPGYVE